MKIALGCLGLFTFAEVASAQNYNGASGADTFASAPQIWARWTTTTPTNLATFTKQAGEPDLKSGSPTAGKTAWWKWQCLQTGWCSVHTTDTSSLDNGVTDTILGVFTGDAVNNLTRVAVSDDLSYNGQNLGYKHSWVRFLAEAGTTYYFVVDGGTSTALNTGSQVVLSLRQYVPTNRTMTGTAQLPDPGQVGFQLPCLITVTTTSTGRLTGKMTTPVKSWSFKGAFSLDGMFDVNLEMPTPKGQPLEPSISLRVDALGTAYLNYKSVITSLGGLHTRLRYTNDAPGQGLYNVDMTDQSDLGGHSFAQVKIKPNGSISVMATLPDGTTTTQGTWLGGESGTQHYISGLSVLYKKKGAQLSQLTLYTGNPLAFTVNGSCFIQRPANFSGSFFESGFSHNLGAYGRLYTPPQAGNAPLGFTGANGGPGEFLLMSHVDEFPVIGNQQEAFTLDPKGKFIFASAVNKPVLKVNVKTGAVTGSIVDTTGVKRKLKGHLLLDDTGTPHVIGQASGSRRTLKWTAEAP